MRSAKAPAISAGVMIAKVIWKQMIDRLGDGHRKRLGVPMPFEMSLRIPCRNDAAESADVWRAGREGHAVGDDREEDR